MLMMFRAITERKGMKSSITFEYEISWEMKSYSKQN